MAVLARYRTCDMHTAGEPVRIVLDGFPEPHGDTMLAKRADAMARLDVHRRRLMLEPRGHAEMYGALPVTACTPGAAFGVLFMHHSGFSTMCGHATVALGRWAVESNRVALRDGAADFVLDCPCGPVDVHVREGGVVVAFDSVPGFAAALDLAVEVAGFGRVVCDIGYGGAFYAILPASRLGLDVRRSPIAAQHAAACAVTAAIRAGHPVRHPDQADLGFLYGTILTDDAPDAGGISRNLCVFGEGQIDRSPTGSGVTARLAVAAARGLVRLGETQRFAGPTGIPFDGTLLAAEHLGERPTFRVQVSGRAFNSGRAEFAVEAEDALGNGFDLAAPTVIAAPADGQRATR
jgi:trans-L-3-hydroxyproline dehydratase